MATVELSDKTYNLLADEARSAGLSESAWLEIAVFAHARDDSLDVPMDDMGFDSPVIPAAR